MSYSYSSNPSRGREGGGRDGDWRGESRDYNRRSNGYQGGGGGGGGGERRDWQNRDREGGDRRGGGGGGGRPAGQFSENLEIDGSQVGFVIGRGGANVRDIQSQFSVRVNIDKNSNYNGKNGVLVSGDSQKDVDDAISHIRDQIQESVSRGGASRY